MPVESLRLCLILCAAVWFWAATSAQAEAGVGEEHILVLISKEASDLDPLAKLRKRAARGKTDELLGLYLHYRVTPRGTAGPSISNDQLVSRQEAEDSLLQAADEGNALAQLLLGAARLYGFSILKDQQAAQLLLSKAAEDAPRKVRPLAQLLLAEAGGAETSALEDLEGEFPGEVAVLRTRMSDPDAARAVLDAALQDTPGLVDIALALRVMDVEGDQIDIRRAHALLSGAIRAKMPRAAGRMGQLYVSGTHVPRLPRYGIKLMSGWAEVDTDMRQQLAVLLQKHHVELDNSQRLTLRLAEDAEVGTPGAARTLVQLLDARRAGFRDEALLFELLEDHAPQDPQIALVQAYYLGRWSIKTSANSNLLAERARNIVNEAILKEVPGAWAMKGRMLSEGLGFEQDHLAATSAYQKGVEAGEIESMLGLAEAHRDGIGVAKDGEAELTLLRRASALGATEAQDRMMWMFKFDMAHKRMTLAEGITMPVIHYGDGLGDVGATDIGAVFSNMRLIDFGTEEVVSAFMDGIRTAPGAVFEERLEWLQSAVPREIWQEVETVLQQSGYYDGEISGLMGPEARKALFQWAIQ